MKNLYCIKCGKEIQKVAYADRGKGFLCEKDWIKHIIKET